MLNSSWTLSSCTNYCWSKSGLTFSNHPKNVQILLTKDYFYLPGYLSDIAWYAELVMVLILMLSVLMGQG